MWYNGIPGELPASCVLLKQYLCQQSSYLRAEPKLMIYYFYYYYCAKLRIAINQSRRDESVIICLISKSPQFRTACSKLANRLFRPRTDRKVLSSERSQLNSVSPGLRNRLAFLDNEQTLPSSKTQFQRRDLLVFLPVLKRIFSRAYYNKEYRAYFSFS